MFNVTEIAHDLDNKCGDSMQEQNLYDAKLTTNKKL